MPARSAWWPPGCSASDACFACPGARRCAGLAFLLSLALLLNACAHEPPAGPSGPSPEIRLGPMLELLQFRTTNDSTTTLLDSQGNAHVFVAAADLREVHHVTVSADGAMQRELVATDSSPSSISAAFDRTGRLNLLMDGVHMVRGATSWTRDAYTPWDAVGITAHQPRLIQVSDGHAWAFHVDGKEVGAHGRWDWYGIGGAPAGIIFPWYSASQKLVIVPETAEAGTPWYAVDPKDNLDATNANFAADHLGKLHVVYSASRTVLATAQQPRYLQMLVNGSQTEERPAPAEQQRSTTLYPVDGKPILSLAPGPADLSRAAVAVDPQSGMLLLVPAHQASLVYSHGAWSVQDQLPLQYFWEPRLAPAGGNAFHLMTMNEGSVYYLVYSQDGWSAPVELGQTKVAGIFGNTWNAVAIASSGHNRAFGVWPIETGIAGRWIEGTREIEVKPRSDVVSLGDGVVVPKSLLEFAYGKATLVTPGWASGFAEAVAAGSHTMLAKQYHDDGQWESLASLVLRDNYGDDLRWYFLGRAAEGMGLCDAAEIYYKLSRERSEKLATRCWPIGSKPCAGLRFPHIVEDRFHAIDVMRAAGQCLAYRQRTIRAGH